MSKWISVEDRLPEGNGDVLATDGYYVDLCMYHQSPPWGFVPETCDHEYFKKVTHWMYLPEPPK